MDAGERFARALAAKDRETLRDVLDPAIEFKAMTPRRFFEPSSVDEVIDTVLLGTWFDEGDTIDALEAVDTGVVVDRKHVRYRFRVTNGDGPHVVEQQAYYDTDADGGRITWMRVMCAGYRPCG